VGLPATPASYLHVAGRTGRRLGGETRPGTVVTVLPPKAVPILESWSNQLGDVAFDEL
jgi:superfamily II DNA/RNA helicase